MKLWKAEFHSSFSFNNLQAVISVLEVGSFFNASIFSPPPFLAFFSLWGGSSYNHRRMRWRDHGVHLASTTSCSLSCCLQSNQNTFRPLNCPRRILLKHYIESLEEQIIYFWLNGSLGNLINPSTRVASISSLYLWQIFKSIGYKQPVHAGNPDCSDLHTMHFLPFALMLMHKSTFLLLLFHFGVRLAGHPSAAGSYP